MVILLVAGITAFLLTTINADRTITIGTSPPGTSGYDIASSLKTSLEKVGFTVDIVTTEATSNLVDLLADPQSPIDVTFLGEAINAQDYPTVNSLGTIGQRGVLFASTLGHHDITSIAQAKGGVIDVGPRDSVVAALITDVLAQYGITKGNTRFVNLPDAATREDILSSGVQLMEFRSNRVPAAVRDMLLANELRLVAIPEARALAGLEPSSDAVEMPIGSINLNPPVPSEDLPTIAQLVTVVGDKSLSPAAAFAIAQELSHQFGPSSQLSEAGEFPNFSDRQLPVNPSAAEFYSTGSIPWEYEHLPPIIADSFTRLLILGTLLLLCASVYSLFLPEAYSLWSGLIKPRTEERYLRSIEAAIADGRPLTVRERQRLSDILKEQDAGQALRQRVETLRPELSEPIEDETPDQGPADRS